MLPAALSLMLFVWLLTLHPAASGRVYAAYGGVYVATALLWLRVVDGVKLSALDCGRRGGAGGHADHRFRLAAETGRESPPAVGDQAPRWMFSPAKDWLTGIISSVLMLTRAGSVATQNTDSAMSSGVSASAPS